MREKLRNKKGFTLAELLIVVAIIAVLVAIMIPVFGASRDKAILARDAANLRSVYAEKLMNEMATTSNIGSITITIKRAADADTDVDFLNTEFECKVTGGNSKGEDLTVTGPGSSGTQTIKVDNDVTVKIDGFPS